MQDPYRGVRGVFAHISALIGELICQLKIVRCLVGLAGNLAAKYLKSRLMETTDARLKAISACSESQMRDICKIKHGIYVSSLCTYVN